MHQGRRQLLFSAMHAPWGMVDSARYSRHSGCSTIASALSPRDCIVIKIHIWRPIRSFVRPIVWPIILPLEPRDFSIDGGGSSRGGGNLLLLIINFIVCGMYRIVSRLVSSRRRRRTRSMISTDGQTNWGSPFDGQTVPDPTYKGKWQELPLTVES